jgi:benzodiazapine receptor
MGRLPILSVESRRRARTPDLLGLGGFLLLSLAVMGIGGAVTAGSVDTWYPTLAKPAFNPPNWVFGPVWGVLYILMAVAGWRVWRTDRTLDRSEALTAFGLQMALNLGWSVLFFGFRLIGTALVEIVLLLAAIIVTAVLFWRIDRPAGVLLLPYIAWVGFAAILNVALWWLN